MAWLSSSIIISLMPPSFSMRYVMSKPVEFCTITKKPSVCSRLPPRQFMKSLSVSTSAESSVAVRFICSMRGASITTCIASLSFSWLVASCGMYGSFSLLFLICFTWMFIDHDSMNGSHSAWLDL